MPPDHDRVDLIEQAFLEGQIDGLRADLAYLWLRAKNKDLRRVARIECGSFCGTKCQYVTFSFYITVS